MFLCTIGVISQSVCYDNPNLLINHSTKGISSNSYRFGVATLQHSQSEYSRDDQWFTYRRRELCRIAVKQYSHPEGGSPILYCFDHQYIHERYFDVRRSGIRTLDEVGKSASGPQIWPWIFGYRECGRYSRSSIPIPIPSIGQHGREGEWAVGSLDMKTSQLTNSNHSLKKPRSWHSLPRRYISKNHQVYEQ